MSRALPDWPGWAEDEALAGKYTPVIRRKLSRRINAKYIVATWLNRGEKQRLASMPEIESFLLTSAGAEVFTALGDILEEQLWEDGWVLGCAAAAALTESIPGTLMTKAETGEDHQPVWCDAGHEHTGHGAAGLLIRARNEDGKRVYLLHKRGVDSDDAGTWTIPGGSMHRGEEPYDAAMRESQEEIGDLPEMMHRHHVIDDHGGWQYTTFVMDAPKAFSPLMNGSTPDEVSGWGWFTKKEIKKLPLHGGFTDSWDTVRRSKEDTVINASASKAVKWPRNLAGKPEPAKLPPDPWAHMKSRLTRKGIPAPAAGVLASIYETWVSRGAATALIKMRGTILAKLAMILQRLMLKEITPAEAEAEISAFANDEARARRIAVTEITHASQAAALAVYRIEGIPWNAWVTAHDADVCALCQENQAAGAVPREVPFPSGKLHPPQHPNCRCALVPVGGARDVAEGVEGVAVMKDGKVSKNSVNYRASGSKDRRCGTCSMFEDYSCTLVAGYIGPDDVCDEWESRLAEKSAETPVVSTQHHPLGREGLWHTPSKKVPEKQQLPAYVQNIARALMRDHGMDESQAIATAINAVKRWAHGDLHWGPRRKVTPEVRAASNRTVREWEALRASHHQ